MWTPSRNTAKTSVALTASLSRLLLLCCCLCYTQFGHSLVPGTMAP